MIKIRTQTSLERYYNYENNTYEFIEDNKLADVEFTFDLDIPTRNILARNISAGNISVNYLTACNIRARDIDSRGITAGYLTARKVTYVVFLEIRGGRELKALRRKKK